MLQTLTPTTAPAPPPVAKAKAPAPAAQPKGALTTWLKVQPVSLARHAAGLRPFRRDEFGSGGAAPSEGHLQAVNKLIDRRRKELFSLAKRVGRASRAATTRAGADRFLTIRHQAQLQVRAIEKIWDFYFEVFGQRQTRYADWLLSCDRIALDCYQQSFLNIGVAKSIPAPPPFTYMETGVSPATFRRDLKLKEIANEANPFSLIQLPLSRLMNPWTLGAVLHEVSHNLQNDLGLDRVIPEAIERTLVARGIPRQVAAVWKRWNRETYADLSGLLLGGPAIVASLMDVIAGPPSITYGFSGDSVHPTPWLRTLISCELLRRMGFASDANAYRRAWLALYPNPRGGGIPAAMLATAEKAIATVVEVICFTKYQQLGGKTLAEVIRFAPKEQTIVEEAARRLAAGTDPGVVPERFLIGASRIALERKLARPETIVTNFYRELARR